MWHFARIPFSYKTLVLSILALTGAFAQSPQLTLDVATNGLYNLSLAGASGTNAVLEGSKNLEDWFILDSAAPQNGVAEFAFEDVELAETWFFRAYSGTPPASPRIRVRVDPNLQAGMLLTPESGGSLRLVDPQGIIYEFTASSNLVTQPVAVQMTVITNFASFPDNDGSLAGVRFSPEGQRFLGAAQLRIIFPTNIPPAEMLAYSFEDAGGGFHLAPSRPATNEVVIQVSSFSGKGVARFSGAKTPNFDQAWDGAQSARRAAEHRQALRDGKSAEQLEGGRITKENYENQLRQSELRKLDEVYRDAVKPYEKAGAENCAIGQGVVQSELERLARQWGRAAGQDWRQGSFYRKLAEFTPKVRCACARQLIERCENEPGVSGSELLKALESLLKKSSEITGRTDAQGCGLGSDEQIRQRLTQAKCFGKWEGTIKLTRIKTRYGRISEPLGEKATLTQTWDNEIKEIFEGRISGITTERIRINNEGKLSEFWTFALVGTYAVGYREKEEVITEDDEEVSTTTESVDNSATPLAVGNVSLWFIDGEFESLGPGGGTSELGFSLPIFEKSETKYRCKTPRPPLNPCPQDFGSTGRRSNYGLFQGYAIPKNALRLLHTVSPTTEFTLLWYHDTEVPRPTGPPEITREEISLKFYRKQ